MRIEDRWLRGAGVALVSTFLVVGGAFAANGVLQTSAPSASPVTLAEPTPTAEPSETAVRPSRSARPVSSSRSGSLGEGDQARARCGGLEGAVGGEGATDDEECGDEGHAGAAQPWIFERHQGLSPRRSPIGRPASTRLRRPRGVEVSVRGRLRWCPRSPGRPRPGRDGSSAPAVGPVAGPSSIGPGSSVPRRHPDRRSRRRVDGVRDARQSSGSIRSRPRPAASRAGPNASTSPTRTIAAWSRWSGRVRPLDGVDGRRPRSAPGSRSARRRAGRGRRGRPARRRPRRRSRTGAGRRRRGSRARPSARRR